MYRQIALPQDVKGDQARAEFTYGVLTVTIPLEQKSEPKRIPVQPAQGSEAQGTQQAPAEKGAAAAKG
jgi:hypothetical protein